MIEQSEFELRGSTETTNHVPACGVDASAEKGARELPAGWEWRPLSQITKFKKGKKPAILFDCSFENALPYIDIEAFENGNFRRFADKSSGVQAVESDVLVVWDGARAGLVGKVSSGLLGSTIAALIPLNIGSDFLRLYLWSKFNEINQNTKGSAIPHIDPTFFWSIWVPVPPPLDQCRIVKRIETFVARVEEAKMLRLEAAEGMNSWMLAELNASFEDLAVQFPSCPLGELFTFRNDVLHPYDKPIGLVRFIGLQHIEPNTGRRIGEDIIQAEQLEGRKFRFSPEEIVYGYLRPYLNKVWIADCEGLCSVDQYVLRPDHSQIEVPYLAYAMRSPYFLRQSEELTGVLMLPRLRSGLLKQISIPLPPLIEQRRVIAYLDGLQAKADAIRAAQAETQKELDALLPAVLDRAFRGKL